MNVYNRPIGVFDSGVGGLTVVKEIMRKLPHENIIYFGDIARLPYGTKSVATIQKFAHQTVQFLLKQEVKAIVIACNTIAANAHDTVRELAGTIPVIDIITAGSTACAQSAKRKVGVIATPATINSNAYSHKIHELNPNIEVISQACALFVPFIEEGFIKHQALELIAQDYLQSLLQEQIDSLILGCTHYPLIRDTISKIVGPNVNLIDPAITACQDLIQVLTDQHLLSRDNKKPKQRFFVTDIPQKFQTIGEMFLETKMNSLELVSLD